MSNDSDNWNTPNWLLRVFSKEGWKDRTPNRYENDCLQIDWKEDSYVNPPYSNPLPFVLKALEEHRKHRIIVVMLLKLDTSTRWYKELANGGAFLLLRRKAALFRQELCSISKRIMHIK